MTNLVEVKVPDIGDFKNVPIIEVLVKPGDKVSREDPLITLESEKATMDVPAPASGVITELKVKAGDKVSEGTPVVMLEAESAPAGAPAKQAATTAPAQTATPAQSRAAAGVQRPEAAPVSAMAPPAAAATPRPEPPDAPRPAPAGPLTEWLDTAVRTEGKASHASPSVRRFARELGVDLASVTGTGPKARILREDVQEYVKTQVTRFASAGSCVGFGLPPLPQIDFSRFGPVQRQTLTRIKKLAGSNLLRNWLTIPHVTQHNEADITELEAFRKAQAEEAKGKDIRLTLLAFVIKACVVALRQYPEFNASLSADGETLTLKQYFHIGVAVDTPLGLVVPVLRDVDKKGLLELAKELGEVSARMRAGKINTTDLQGGCFSISSLGGIGGTAFTPIINAPEVAILGVSKAQLKPVWTGTQFAPRLMLPLSLSYDHRVIDGAQGARFITFLTTVLSDIRRLVL
jgi:pyruvate dehydrogenase E2 component (dihydrolipoamide acetyltransferase)